MKCRHVHVLLVCVSPAYGTDAPLKTGRTTHGKERASNDKATPPAADGGYFYAGRSTLGAPRRIPPDVIAANSAARRPHAFSVQWTGMPIDDSHPHDELPTLRQWSITVLSRVVPLLDLLCLPFAANN